MYVDITISVSDEQFKIIDLNRKLIRSVIQTSLSGREMQNILWVKEFGKNRSHEHYHMVIELEIDRADNIQTRILTKLNKKLLKNNPIPKMVEGRTKRGKPFRPVYSHAVPVTEHDMNMAVGYCLKEDHELIESTWDENYLKTCKEYFMENKRIKQLAKDDQDKITQVNDLFNKFKKFMTKIEHPKTRLVAISSKLILRNTENEHVWAKELNDSTYRTAYDVRYVIEFLDAVAHRTSYLCLTKVDVEEFSRIAYAALNSERNLDKVVSTLNSSKNEDFW